MDVLTGLALLTAFCIAYRLFQRSQRPRNRPPTPPGLPVVGNLSPTFAADPPAKVTEWNRKYGSTITVAFGAEDQVFMSDFDTVKTVYNDENTTGRSQTFILARLLNQKGFLASEGELWREHRRFALSKLRDLGMGKSWMEDAMLEEISELISIYGSSKGRPVDPRPHLTVSISNVISAMIFGKRFEHSDERFKRLCGLFAENIALIGKALPVQFFPWLKHVPFFANAFNAIARNILDLNKFMQEMVTQHKRDHAPTGDKKEAVDYIDLFLEEQDRKKMDKSSTYDDEELMAEVLGLFAAGTETSTSTLLWAFVFMVENPDVLAKIHAEIDAAVGRDRPIRMSDKVLLKYTDAALLEVQRLASVVSFGVSHTNFEPMKIDGFDIPARTVLNTNAYAMHYDPRYWTHPNQFYPEHFLTADGSVTIPKGFIPFGIGKRMCLGESLAKMNIHLFFANIVQRFDIQRAPNSTLSSQNFTFGFARTPKVYDVCFVSRQP